MSVLRDECYVNCSVTIYRDHEARIAYHGQEARL
jgi:hypothetical protein